MACFNAQVSYSISPIAFHMGSLNIGEALMSQSKATPTQLVGRFEHIRKSLRGRSQASIVAIASLVAVFVGAGCKGDAAGAEAGVTGVSDYATDASGLVSEIGPEFFKNKKLIYIDDGGKRLEEVWLRVYDNEMHVEGVVGRGSGGAVREDVLREGVCKGIVAGGQSGYTRFYSICVSAVSVNLGVNSDGEAIAANTPYFQIATKDGSETSIMRSRFTVEDISAQREEQKTSNPEARPVSKCELIEQGEATARQQCQSGNFNACRDITGWVAEKAMESCSSGESSSMGQDGAGLAAPQDMSSQLPFSSSDLPPVQEQIVAQSATIDATSRNMNPPRYPPAAARAGIGGVVHLLIAIDGSGGIANVSVERSSRNRDLDRAAMDAARKWKFRPVIVDGAGIPGSIRTTVEFRPGEVSPAPEERSDPLEHDATKYFSPSFSCAAASTASEHAICGDKDLAELDRDIADAYAEVLRRHGGGARGALLANQREWIKRRDAACGSDVACLKALMRERPMELEDF